MPTEQLDQEYGPLIARRDDEILIHTVLLPDEISGTTLCKMSQGMVSRFLEKKNIYYHLISGDDWQEAAAQVTQHADAAADFPLATKKQSYPHLTLFHAWMTPPDAIKYIEAVINEASLLTIPAAFPMTGSLQFHIPHWCKTVGDPDRMDDIRWTGVKPAPLVALQGELATIAQQNTDSAQITTALGDAWKAPHFTLLGRRDQNGGAVANQDQSQQYIVHPTLAIGVSGGNGQFRAPVAIINGPHGTTRPETAYARLNLLRLFS